MAKGAMGDEKSDWTQVGAWGKQRVRSAEEEDGGGIAVGGLLEPKTR